MSGMIAVAPPGGGRPVMSSPAENARPEPVITTTRTASSICASVNISIKSRLNPCVIPFNRSGWLNVTTAAPLSSSAISNPLNVPCCIAIPPLRLSP